MPRTIDPNAIYRNSDVIDLFDIGPRTLGNACAQGRLRCKYIGDDRVFVGQWLLDYLEGNEPSREVAHDHTVTQPILQPATT